MEELRVTYGEVAYWDKSVYPNDILDSISYERHSADREDMEKGMSAVNLKLRNLPNSVYQGLYNEHRESVTPFYMVQGIMSDIDIPEYKGKGFILTEIYADKRYYMTCFDNGMEFEDLFIGVFINRHCFSPGGKLLIPCVGFRYTGDLHKTNIKFSRFFKQSKADKCFYYQVFKGDLNYLEMDK